MERKSPTKDPVVGLRINVVLLNKVFFISVVELQRTSCSFWVHSFIVITSNQLSGNRE